MYTVRANLLFELLFIYRNVHTGATSISCFFLSCEANARVKLAKTEHGPHSSTLVCICVARLLLFVLFGCYLCCSMYCLCVNVYCHRVTTELQVINISNISIPQRHAADTQHGLMSINYESFRLNSLG